MTELANEETKDATTSPTESEESTEQQISESEETSETETDETKPGFKPIEKRGPPPSWERFNEVYGQMKRLDRLALQLLEERKTQKPEKREPEEEPDYNSFTPKQLVDYVRKTNRRDMEEVLSKTLTPLQEQAKTRAASDSISRASAKYKDFFDYRESMIEIAERHPTLDAEEVYLIASGKKGEAGEKIMTRVKEKVEQKKNALTTRRSSLAPKITTSQGFKTVREGALAAAKELGFNID